MRILNSRILSCFYQLIQALSLSKMALWKHHRKRIPKCIFQSISSSKIMERAMQILHWTMIQLQLYFMFLESYIHRNMMRQLPLQQLLKLEGQYSWRSSKEQRHSYRLSIMLLSSLEPSMLYQLQYSIEKWLKGECRRIVCSEIVTIEFPLVCSIQLTCFNYLQNSHPSSFLVSLYRQNFSLLSF
jgi:hypothetical protein